MAMFNSMLNYERVHTIPLGQFWSPPLAIHSGVTPPTLWAKNGEGKHDLDQARTGDFFIGATNSQTHQTQPDPITKLNFCPLRLRWREKIWNGLNVRTDSKVVKLVNKPCLCGNFLNGGVPSVTSPARGPSSAAGSGSGLDYLAG